MVIQENSHGEPFILGITGNEDCKAISQSRETVKRFPGHKSNGVTGVEPRVRKDKGRTRKTSPEQLVEAVNQVLHHFKKVKSYNKTDVYRKIIEEGIISRIDLAATTFYRFCRDYGILSATKEESKKR